MPVSLMSVTLSSGPKLDFTSAIFVISAFVAALSAPDEQPASTQQLRSRANLNTGANLPKTGAQPRNVDTVFTSKSAANCGVNAGSAEPGS